MKSLVGAGAHVLVVPYPAQGHMEPLLDLSHQLANRGLTLTVVVTPKNLPYVTPLLSSHPSSVKTLVLPFPAHPSIPSGVENAKDVHQSAYGAIMRALADLYCPLLQWFELKTFLPLPPPVAIISDMFLGWTHNLACHLGIPRIVFSPSGATALSIIYSVWQDMRDFGGDLTAVVSFPKLPNRPKFPLWQVSPMYRAYMQGYPKSQIFKDVFRANLESWGLVVNTFDGLERAYLDHLAIQLGHERVWAVGPLLRSPPDHKNSKSDDDLFLWLDSCAHHSVVYIAFGSQAVLTDRQMEELALGLEKSGVKFIWCVKNPTKDQAQAGQTGCGTIPIGFQQRVAGRGLVIKGWSPQVQILSHGAVGAFMTHCGWNSVVEAIVCGVPMLAWPMHADQFSNATLLVDELKVAVRACEGAMTVPNSDELSQVVAESARGDWKLRARAEELRKAASETVDHGGNSTTNLDDLALALCSSYLEI